MRARYALSLGISAAVATTALSAQARVVWLHLECSPCFARVCPLGHFRCMNELSVERVLEEIERLGVLTSPAA